MRFCQLHGRSEGLPESGNGQTAATVSTAAVHQCARTRGALLLDLAAKETGPWECGLDGKLIIS